MVGWRENATLFEACLRSVDALADDVGKVVFVSNGNEPDDVYLADIFRKVFPDAEVMRLDYVLTEVGKARREELYRQCTYGEDRHLTARLLRRGFRVVYTHRARCLTETPTAWPTSGGDSVLQLRQRASR